MKQEQRRFTSDELALLRKLRGQRIPYSVIAERLGRSPAVLKVTMCKPPRMTVDEREERREGLVREFEATKSMAELARRRGVTEPSIANMLDRAGVDAEMRQAIRREVAPCEALKGMN